MMLPEEVIAAVRAAQAQLVTDGHDDVAQALADAVHTIHARELDNHHAADRCPYCTPDPAMRRRDEVDVDAAMRELFPERYEEEPAQTDGPVQYNGRNGLAVFADAARRLSDRTRLPMSQHAYVDGRFGDDGICHAPIDGGYPHHCYRPRPDTVHGDRPAATRSRDGG
jgi:hypothetical protein